MEPKTLLKAGDVSPGVYMFDNSNVFSHILVCIWEFPM